MAGSSGSSKTPVLFILFPLTLKNLNEKTETSMKIIISIKPGKVDQNDEESFVLLDNPDEKKSRCYACYVVVI